MDHVKRFQSIPMSKSMRGLCKEEDYVFLGMSETLTQTSTHGQTPLKDNKEDRVRRRLEREKQEQERLRALEQSKEDKEQQWKMRIAELTSKQAQALQDRLTRLKRFREFQRKVLGEEGGMEGEAAGQLLTRM